MKNKYLNIKLIIFLVMIICISLLTFNVIFASNSVEVITIDIEGDKEDDYDDYQINVNNLTTGKDGTEGVKISEYINNEPYIVFTVGTDGKYELDLNALGANEIQIFRENSNEQVVRVGDTNGVYTLNKGVRYAIKLYSGRAGDMVQLKYTNTTAAMSEDSETPETPQGATGSRVNPYVINRDKEIKYDSVPFYFRLDYSSADGQYEIVQDVKNKTVKFRYIDNRVDVAYYDPSSKSESDRDYVYPYVQAGANANRLQKKPTYPKYAIKTYESSLLMPSTMPDVKNGYTREYLLNNAFLKGESAGGGDTASTAYVLVSTRKNFNDAFPKFSYSNSNMVDIVYSFDGNYDAFEDMGQATGLEALIARILTGIGDLYASLLRLILGTNCTIDNIIFNDFEPTRLDFFNSGAIASEVKNVINTWFKLFSNLAYLIYFIFLVYVAIQVMLNSGKKAYREYISNWIIGLLLLAIMPMFLGYVFKINDAFVAMIGKNRGKTYSMINYNTDFDEKGTAGEDSKTAVVEKLLTKKNELEISINETLANFKKETENSFANLLSKMGDIVDDVYKQDFESEYNDACRSINSYLWYEKKGLDLPETDKTLNSLIDVLYRVIIKSNNSYNTVEEIDAYVNIKEITYTYARNIKKYYDQRTELAGVDAQIEAVTSGTDLMGDMRTRAGKTYRLAYAIVYIFMLFQLTFLLMLYYKRIFVIAMLIIIFPLVMATYVKDKTADGKADILNTWWKEFFANVFVQFIHAVIYVILVEAGLNIYKADQNNWLVFLLSIVFLFPAESILRSILGLESSTLVSLKGTVGRAALGIGAGVAVARSLGNGKSKAEQEAEAKKKSAAEESKKQKEAEAKKKNELKKKQGEVKKARARARVQTSTGADREKYRERAEKLSQKLDKKETKRENKSIKRQKRNLKLEKLKNSKAYKATRKGFRAARRIYGATVGISSALAGGGSPSDFIAGSAMGSSIGGVTGKWKNYDPEDSKVSTPSARRAKVQKALEERKASKNNASNGNGQNGAGQGSGTRRGGAGTFGGGYSNGSSTSNGANTNNGGSGTAGGRPKIKLNVSQKVIRVNGKHTPGGGAGTSGGGVKGK